MLPFGMVSDPWVHWGAIVGIIAGILGIIAAVVKAAQWLDERNVEQMEAVYRRITQTNGGNSLRDDVQAAVRVGRSNSRAIESLRKEFRSHVDAGAQIIEASNASRRRFDQHMADHDAVGWTEGIGAPQ